MTKYLDFHAHNVQHLEDVKVIRSLFLQDYTLNDLPSDGLFSIGLHPWHVDHMTLDEVESKLISFVESKRIAFIGESGLDKIKGTDWDKQVRVFELHAKIAEEYKLPLIIHSVKAHQEVMNIRREIKATVPWVIHSFASSKQMAFDLLKNGFSFSICFHLLNKESRISGYFCDLPVDRIFLETDDFNVSIYDLYKVAAQKLKITEDNLKRQIMLNLDNLLDGR